MVSFLGARCLLCDISADRRLILSGGNSIQLGAAKKLTRIHNLMVHCTYITINRSIVQFNSNSDSIASPHVRIHTAAYVATLASCGVCINWPATICGCALVCCCCWSSLGADLQLPRSNSISAFQCPLAPIELSISKGPSKQDNSNNNKNIIPQSSTANSIQFEPA